MLRIDDADGAGTAIILASPPPASLMLPPTLWPCIYIYISHVVALLLRVQVANHASPTLQRSAQHKEGWLETHPNAGSAGVETTSTSLCTGHSDPTTTAKKSLPFLKKLFLLVVVHKELEGRRGCCLQPLMSCVGDDAWFRNLNAQQQRHNMEYIYIYTYI
jgi:hypothetical protein